VLIASNVLDIAREQVGISEDPPGSNRVKYWADLKPEWQGQPWCGAFTAWCWQRAGVDLVRELGNGAYYCPSIVAWARKIGAWTTDHAEPGDLVLYSFGRAEAQHVGIAWPDPVTASYRAIEGNTSPDSAGSQDNGGGVHVRYRPRYQILGWVRMSIVAARSNIAEAPAPVQPTPPIRPQLDEDGILGPQTYRALQRVIGTTPDGAWGPLSKRALQRWLGVTQDGIIGRQTVTALQQRVGARVDGQWGPATTRALQHYLNTRV
jgi:hypothetical protein